MKQAEIKEGLIYHNGKTGNRSYSARKVIEIYLGRTRVMVKYEQVIGRFKGSYENLKLESFSQWAKGVVTDEIT
jgi:hypothetical protein